MVKASSNAGGFLSQCQPLVEIELFLSPLR